MPAADARTFRPQRQQQDAAPEQTQRQHTQPDRQAMLMYGLHVLLQLQALCITADATQLAARVRHNHPCLKELSCSAACLQRACLSWCCLCLCRPGYFAEQAAPRHSRSTDDPDVTHMRNGRAAGQRDSRPR